MPSLKRQFITRNSPTKIINFKCTEEELVLMKKNADKFADGNLSAWIRFSTIELEPKKRHLEDDRKTKPNKGR